MAFWYFPSNDHGENKGINDSGVAMFRGTPLKSLAREICQNSLDAARAELVHVEFNAFSTSPDSLPDSNFLRRTFEKCAEFWSAQKAKTTKDFFNNAIDKISANKIQMLRISDFYTTGLKGSDKEINTDWTNLTKSSGVSDKGGTAGGSFGIGKFAPFACSDFSTVFYSTLDDENNRASQGVSRLVTFRREDGETTQGIGYYGNEKNTPVFEMMEIDKSFSRGQDDYGTDIFIAGYKYAGDDWKDSIIISILDGFLGAIWNNRLTVNVGDVEISKKTLQDLIDTYRDELTGYTDKYYTVLTSEKSKWFEEDFMGKGTIKLGLLIDPNMHRKVAMIRKTGMKIKDKDRLSNIPFAGVMFIEGEEINRDLRQMENPEHTEWQPDRITENPIAAKEILKELNVYMKKCIDVLASDGSYGEIDAAGVGSLLPDISEREEDMSREETVTDKVASVEKRIIIKKHRDSERIKSNDKYESEGSFKEGDEGEGWLHNDEEGKHPDDRPPAPVGFTNEGDQKVPSMKEILISKIRVICTDKTTGKYSLIIVPATDGKDGCISINLSAETESYEAPIISALNESGQALSIKQNRIQGVIFVKNQPEKYQLHINFMDYCAMEVKAYAITE